MGFLSALRLGILEFSLGMSRVFNGTFQGIILFFSVFFDVF